MTPESRDYVFTIENRPELVRSFYMNIPLPGLTLK